MRPPDHELIYVRESFAKWRYSRPGAKPRIPLELKSLAVGLIASRSLRSVADALKLNCNTLRDWRDQGIMPSQVPTPTETTSSSQVNEYNFVELEPAMTSEGTIELLLPTGILLKVTPTTPPAYVARLVSALRCVER